MLIRSSIVTLAAIFVLGLSIAACGSDDQGDCVSRCSEAQQKKCTNIKGDCGTFCAAVLSLAQKASCGAQMNAYLSCTNAGDVCTTDARCGSQTTNLGTCTTSYCLQNPTDADCKAVLTP